MFYVISQIFRNLRTDFIIDRYMYFKLIDLVKLKLKRQQVPLYEGVKGKLFPQTIPFMLVFLCFMSSLLKLSIPMILQQTYAAMSSQNVEQKNYLALITIVIIAIGLSQLVLIAYGLMLTLYRLNVKRQLSSRILENNYRDYKQTLQSTIISDKADHFSMDLWVKISTKLPVYLHNYYESYLSLIFQSLNIIVIVIYLFYKLSFSLFFGLSVAGLVMYKTIKTASLMQNIRFSNIELRSRRLKILQHFFSRVTQFKMCWLDKWIYERVTSIENQFQEGLRHIKLLDCWCVALWQFTGVGISSIVISAYFLLGFSQSVDKDSVFTPSTFVYLLTMLNFPLNALSWYINGVKTAKRAIRQIENDVRVVQITKQSNYEKIVEQDNCLIVKEPITLKYGFGNLQIRDHSSITIPIKQIQKNKIYSVIGQYSQNFLAKLIFLLECNISKGYVQQNAWLTSSPLQTFCMNQSLTGLKDQQKQRITTLMELFQCHDIPLETNTQNYSGGQKLRISLVRAFNLGQIIVINTNLNSLDHKMKQKIKQQIFNLVHNAFPSIQKNYTVFIRQNEEFADEIISFRQTFDNTVQLNFKQQINKYKTQQQKISISPQILKFMQQSIIQLALSKVQIEQKSQKIKIEQIQFLQNQKQQKSIVTFQTFKIYYKSKKHIVFAISMIIVTLLSNYYNYYVNTYINLSEYNSTQVIVILAITVVFAVGLFFRSYYFADANLEQASRICHDLNKNIIMEQLSFYQSQEKIKEDSEQINSKSKLICALTSDTETIADHFPFDTNIFANNVTVIISSVIIILIEVPQMIILLFFLVIYANRINKMSHKKDEALKIALKQQEVKVYKIISDIQAGRKYVIIHNKFSDFSDMYCKYKQQFLQLEWLNDKFGSYINLKYKLASLLFLIAGVAAYTFFNVLRPDIEIINTNHDSNKTSSGLALLIQYTIQLSNYLLFFTVSIWKIKGLAVSFERVRPYLEQKESIRQRIQASNQMIAKINQSHKEQHDKSIINKSMVSISQLTFAYQTNPNIKIFKNLNLQIVRGDKIIIKGRSGSGKTTLYKLITSAYPKIINFTNQPFFISFSPQHPLLLPDTQDIAENLNPYKIPANLHEIDTIKKKHSLNSTKNVDELTYQQKIILNNLRAYLYGYQGIIIYDQPQQVINGREDTTYIIVTHHQDFNHNCTFEVVDGQLAK